MRTLILVVCMIGAAQAITSCASSGCCDCPPTGSPTATPTAAPTEPSGRCCGKVDGANFCLVTTSTECGAPEAAEPPGRRSASAADFFAFMHARRALAGENFTVGSNCTSDPCEGVPSTGTSSSGGATTITVNVDHAGFNATTGIATKPVAVAGLPALPDTANGATIILAFNITRYDGVVPVEDGFLADGNFLLVTLQTENPEFSETQPIIVWRLDEATGEWVNAEDDCKGRISDGDLAHEFDSELTPPAWIVPICHTSQYAVSNATNATDDDDDDDHKDKPDKKGKKEKEATKPTKSAKDVKGEAKSKSKKEGDKKKVAIGAGVGAGVAVLLVGGGAYMCSKRKASSKKAGKKERKTATKTSALPKTNLTV